MVGVIFRESPFLDVNDGIIFDVYFYHESIDIGDVTSWLIEAES